jgi:hypothetical protein
MKRLLVLVAVVNVVAGYQPNDDNTNSASEVGIGIHRRDQIENVCLNSNTFNHLGMSCSDIEFSAETLREHLCQLQVVHNSCIKACGR